MNDDHLKHLKSERSMKRASRGKSAKEMVMSTLLEGLEDISKTRVEKLRDQKDEEGNVEEFPTGFRPYNEIWRYEPVESSYFFKHMLGESLRPLQQEAADAIVGKDPFEITDLNYDLGVYMWGKGSGKDSTIAKIFTYQAYKLACLINPQKFLGLGIDSPIDIVNVASNSEQAKGVFFKYLKSYVKRAKDMDTGYPWFSSRNWMWDVGRRKFNYMDLRDKDGAFKNNVIDFGRNISCRSLTSDRFTAEGLTIFIAVMDEIGAMRAENIFGSKSSKKGTGGKMIGQLDSLGSSIRSRTKYGKLVAISYKYGKNCPMSMLVRKESKNPRSHVRVHSVYDVRDDKTYEELKQQNARDYINDEEKAKMIYECKDPELETDNFFSDKFVIKNAIDVNEKFSVNPMKKKIITTSDYDHLEELLEPWFKGQDEYFYAIHADLAKGQTWLGHDAAGIAMGHLEEMRVTYDKAWVKYYKETHGIDLSEREGELRMGIVIDLLLQITATKEQKEIRVSDIRKFIIALQEKRNFGILKVTLDRWGSHETIQELNDHGIQAELLSVDKTKIPYETQKGMMQQGIWKCYENSIWVRECEELLDLNNKVDHPEISISRFENEVEGVEHGSKDLADCTAAVSKTLVTELMEGGGIYFG